jgi:hypothetical protein
MILTTIHLEIAQIKTKAFNQTKVLQKNLQQRFLLSQTKNKISKILWKLIRIRYRISLFYLIMIQINNKSFNKAENKKNPFLLWERAVKAEKNGKIL